ncbi:unnamed protein product [Vitrella brassicaformis CCMP3155]|uniref:F-box domain-containing protein n=2 Tax=Vitrella brassicaformis TaxID=1169539 RepID=A0A0G4H6J5_VITBC|nr:unnamed protein product [Vitrella brassicaformis CCMP3155]|eukprot:CEM39467.1 unnamed protein product [Vitrella brassicaformis CCMP3155]
MAHSSKKRRTSKEAAFAGKSGGDDSSIAQPDDTHAESVESLPLLSIPLGVRSTLLSPLLVTQCIIGSLSLVKSAFHTLAIDPQMHRTIYLKSRQCPKTLEDKQIRLSDRQVDAWSPRLSRTKRIIML